ncbi:MAG: hypothetical protein LBR29_04400, partial [Methylobacteriaceae bacterium]|nr:hypothetical protein [Methylobacteriaceae bacterium]
MNRVPRLMPAGTSKCNAFLRRIREKEHAAIPRNKLSRMVGVHLMDSDHPLDNLVEMLGHDIFGNQLFGS